MREQLPEVTIHRWGPEIPEGKQFCLVDTTLRDGIQAPGIEQPSLEQKLAIIDFDARIGIEVVDVCLPGIGGSCYKEGVECARYIAKNHPHMEIVVLARTTQSDVDATLRFSEEAGVPLSVVLFRGSSDLRLLAEGWDEQQIIDDMYDYTRLLVSGGQKVVCSTEDTTRTRPDFLEKIFLAGKDGGAKEFCIADTVGYTDPFSVENQSRWVREKLGSACLGLHFHGHNDIGMAVANSLAALKGGADKIHVTWRGVGERAGNTPLEAFLGVLYTFGIEKYDLSMLVGGSQMVSEIFNRPIPVDSPLIGDAVYTTSTGIHAAGIHKAEQRGQKYLADIVYSAVPPSILGRKHTINIGPLSGRHNVERVLEKLEIPVTEKLVKALLKAAKLLNRDLSSKEIGTIITQIKIL